MESSKTLARVRESLFILTGLALPFYAFPVARALGKPPDLATICAALFVLTSLPLLPSGTRLGPAIFAAGCVFLPLLALLPPRPGFFEVHAFARSYAHWLLIIAFFLGALRLNLTEGGRKRVFLANAIMATAVAFFCIRSWGFRATGPRRGRHSSPFSESRFGWMRSLGADQPRTGHDDSVHVRFQNTLCMARLALRHPLRGVGLGQFVNCAKIEGKAQERILGEAWCGKDAWEGWPGVAAEAGMGGPVLLLGAFSVVLRRGRQAARESTGSSPFLAPALVAFAAVAQICTASYIDLWWWYPLSLAAAASSSRARAGKP